MYFIIIIYWSKRCINLFTYKVCRAEKGIKLTLVIFNWKTKDHRRIGDGEIEDDVMRICRGLKYHRLHSVLTLRACSMWGQE